MSNGGHLTMSSPSIEPETFKPHIPPRDLADFMLSYCTALLAVCGSAGLAAALAFAMTGNGIAALVGFQSSAALLVILFRRVQLDAIRADADGLHFDRRGGAPRSLRWYQVTEVEPVSSKELLLRAWLSPRVFSREPSRSATTRGYYRLCWHGGLVYFCPEDPVAFERVINGYRQRQVRSLVTSGLEQGSADVVI